MALSLLAMSPKESCKPRDLGVLQRVVVLSIINRLFEEEMVKGNRDS